MAKNFFGKAVKIVAAAATVLFVTTSCDPNKLHELDAPRLTTIDGKTITTDIYTEKLSSDSTEIGVKISINGNTPVKIPFTQVQSFQKDRYESSDLSTDMSSIERNGGTAVSSLKDGNVLKGIFSGSAKTVEGHTFSVKLVSATGQSCYNTQLYNANDSTAVETTASRKYTYVLVVDGSEDYTKTEDVVMTSKCTRWQLADTPAPTPDPTKGWIITSTFSSNESSSTGSFLVVTTEDGTEKSRETVSATGPNSLVCLTNWSSTEKNYNQSTSSVVVKSRNTEEITSGKVKYTVTTTVYTTTTSLNGSTQTNTWRRVESNNFTYVGPDGKTYTAAAAAGIASVDGGRVSGGTYSNVLTYTFNGKTQTVSAPGRITVVSDPIDPDYPGTYKSSGVCAVVYGSSWRYGVAVTTTAGTKVFAINQNGTLVEGGWYSGDAYAYNCSFELNGTLVPCLAKNGSGKLIWCDSAGKAYQSIYDAAWQARGGNNKKNTVYTDDYKTTVTKDGSQNLVKIVSGSGKVLKTIRLN